MMSVSQQGAFPAKAQNPVFLDGQVFWGMEWPIAEAAVRTADSA